MFSQSDLIASTHKRGEGKDWGFPISWLSPVVQNHQIRGKTKGEVNTPEMNNRRFSLKILGREKDTVLNIERFWV